MKEFPIEVLFNEINQALEKGVAEATERVKTVNSTFTEVMLAVGEVYAGEIGKAICEVFKKYTEGGK